MGIGVAVEVGFRVGVDVGLGVKVGVKVGLIVGIGVCVEVTIGVGVDPILDINSYAPISIVPSNILVFPSKSTSDESVGISLLPLFIAGELLEILKLYLPASMNFGSAKGVNFSEFPLGEYQRLSLITFEPIFP